MSIKNYEKPNVTTDVVLLSTGYLNKKMYSKVLLIKRDESPCLGKWSLPGGFVNIDEDIEENAIRKLQEKTGYSNVYLEQLYTFGDLHRDERGRIISVSYIGVINESAVQKGTKESKWFWINRVNDGIELIAEDETEKIFCTVDNSQLAFDHYKIIKTALDRISNKIWYSNIAFEFLPDKFILRDLKMVFECFLGKSLLNFQRSVSEMVVETGEKLTGQANRPAMLYKRADRS